MTPREGRRYVGVNAQTQFEQLIIYNCIQWQQFLIFNYNIYMGTILNEIRYYVQLILGKTKRAGGVWSEGFGAI